MKKYEIIPISNFDIIHHHILDGLEPKFVEQRIFFSKEYFDLNDLQATMFMIEEFKVRTIDGSHALISSSQSNAGGG